MKIFLFLEARLNDYDSRLMLQNFVDIRDDANRTLHGVKGNECVKKPNCDRNYLVSFLNAVKILFSF